MMVKMPGFSGILYYDRATHTRVVLLSNLGSASGEETAPFVKIARRVVELYSSNGPTQLPLLMEGFSNIQAQNGLCTGGTGVIVPLVVMFMLLGAFWYLSK